MKLSALSALLLATASLPTLADDGLPRGWQGALQVYSCQPDEWFRNSQGVWQNPTCVNISGGGNPASVGLPPDEEDDEDPVDEDDEDDEGEDDDCACLPDTVEEPTAQV